MSDLQVYLLAGGNGKRAGGPKAWQAVEGTTLLEKQLSFLLGRFAAENIAVSIQEAWKERCSRLQPSIAWVPEDPEGPPMAAIIALMKAKPLRNWGFLYHVDMPVWEPGLFDALERAIPEAARQGWEAMAPVYGGRKGHPVLLSAQLSPATVALDPARDRLDLFLRSRREGTVDVPYPCIHENWNKLEERQKDEG